MNRTALAALLLALAAPSRGDDAALRTANILAHGGSPLAAYDGGADAGAAGRIQRAADGALQTGGLVVAAPSASPAASAEVPAPALNADREGSKDKPGFFSKLFSGNGLLYALGGGVAGAAVGWYAGGAIGAIGGPLGALIGGLIGAVGGFFLSKLLAK
ncbi:MAG: hypothetical protein HY403_09710 [Elusimicrobia bacterium]|nr:hypothetical protein [Elusimicrobiota bacterium]